ncbi:DNA/RNA polymerase [Wolfiporia cocos MD-104 SS10]|uniref:Mitochondrial DNA polymerase catalytic subunit n=1 Tax=Wolfiporia cocos (strain MD-104) TaxID=742152 RepID=A0A2H3JE82_WOLCO|nr:DNA/RNA polymerase [Wolfiporia cocos MD-104 SS10]
MAAADPWLALAQEFAGAELPPMPKEWCTDPGWTRYIYVSNGHYLCDPVECPMFDGKPEQMLAFDVETLPECCPYPMMACAVSKNAWYSWISPWLVGKSDHPKDSNLVPIGDSAVPRVVIGHNVSYDRARIKEEYNINTTGTRFLDTMALHVAVKGISSHQREKTRIEEAIEVLNDALSDLQEELSSATNPARQKQLQKVISIMSEGIAQLQQADHKEPVEEDKLATKCWEELTSAESLADIAKLHCGITMDKDFRNDFLTRSPKTIRMYLQDYLNYCATHTAVTHAVFAKMFPVYLKMRPSPVSFAGMLTMSSSLLMVSEQRGEHSENTEHTCSRLSNTAKLRLVEPAEPATGRMHTMEWKSGPWFSQLDWTPIGQRYVNPEAWDNVQIIAALPNVELTEGHEKWGILLPLAIAMSEETHRTIEDRWLTTSDATKRIGSNLKGTVRSPPAYSIIGATIDSGELWIASIMGDAQFGLHGATALGWMTLEGTKAAGTDLDSKTAKILGISQDQARVFNYSRIHGTGMHHAVQLLLQANASLSPGKVQKAAERLYASTKGNSIRRDHCFGRKFWHGGMESLVFNKLEEIAMSSKPQTPALGCGVTDALSKEYLPETFGGDYMTSRINWVVQSSGVDYLHLLIVAMDHLIRKYKIHARYLISVHDELRYLVKEEDQYRAALALQIANLWTRSLFAFKLGMSDLPQGVAFFSAVDIDKYLRKEVNMDCVMPSQPTPLPPGESLDIKEILDKTGGGSLSPVGVSVQDSDLANLTDYKDYKEPECLVHRAQSEHWLKAQVTDDFSEVKALDTEYKKLFGSSGKRRMTKNAAKSYNNLKRFKRMPLGNGQGFDYDEIAEQMLAHSTQEPF